MSRSTLKFLAVLLGVLMVVVWFANLDGLPRSLRAQVKQEQTELGTAQKQLHAAQDEVLADLKSESQLFQAIPASQQWPEQLSKSLGDLQLVSHQVDELAALDKRNRRQDRQQMESLLSQERALRTKLLADATGIQKDAAHWIDIKRHLPEEVQRMERDYGVIHGFDLAPVTAKVRKAEVDWPEKLRNLEKRLDEVTGLVTQAEGAWQSSADARRMAAANDLTKLDLVGLVAADNSLKSAATELPDAVKKLEKHADQLYVAWDKILVDMEVRSGKHYEQRLRTVETHFSDAAAKSGNVTSDEKWVEVPENVYDSEKNNLGMAIEHKAAGMYEAEADHVPQPAGMAYVAPPSQGSNQYGYWDHRDGRSFWVFYGQYALMRDLLFNHQYIPVETGDWEGYRTYQSRGQTYYGGSTTTSGTATQAPKFGTQGSTTQSRYSNSSFAKSGGFKDSKYASKSGSYSSSPYATPGNTAPKQFGSGSRSSGSGAATSSRPSSPSRPSPRPSPRPSSSGRRFGRR